MQSSVTQDMFANGLLDSQVMLVSGGGSGIGRAVVLQLARMGATVVTCGRREAPLIETVAMAGPGRVEHQVCDIREQHQVEAMVDGILERHGRIDGLVNNAGGQFFAPAESISPKGFHTVVKLNLEGTWLMTHTVANRAFIPSGRGGRVISVTLTPHAGMPGIAHSSAARAGVENLMKVLAIEWARHGITLNAVAAGIIETDTYRTKYPDSVRDYSSARRVPLRRLGTPGDMAHMVAFLLSPGAAYVTGTIIKVDGGFDLYQGQFPPEEMLGIDGRLVAEQRRVR